MKILQIFILMVFATNSGITQNNIQKLKKIELEKSKVDSIIEKYQSMKFNEYDNLMYAFQELFMEPIFYERRHYSNEFDFIKALNKEQKVFFWLLTFDGQVLNGGLTQYFWNYGIFSKEIISYLEEIGSHELLEKYIIAFEDFQKVKEPFLLLTFEDDPNSFAKAREMFNGNDFDSYYYENREKHYKSVANYVSKHLESFAVLQ